MHKKKGYHGNNSLPEIKTINYRINKLLLMELKHLTEISGFS